MPALLKTLKPDLAVQAVALGSMIAGSSTSATTDPAGNLTFKVTHTTLADVGFKEMRLVVTARDDLRGSVTLTASNKAEAAKRFKVVTDGLERGKVELRRQAGRDKEAQLGLNILESVKVTTGPETLTLEGRADGKAVSRQFLRMFGIRSAP
jgi:hypothetical protein